MYSFLTDSSRNLADQAVLHIGTDASRFNDFLQLSIRESYPINMRAARVLVLCAEQHPWLTIPHLHQLITALETTTTDGVKRGCLKLLTPHFAVLNEEDQGVLIDLCFKLLESMADAIAVKAYSIDILIQAVKIYPDLQQEFVIFLEHLNEKLSITEQSPALRASIRNAIKATTKRKTARR